MYYTLVLDEKTWEVSKVWIYFGSSDICVDLLDLFQEIAKKQTF